MKKVISVLFFLFIFSCSLSKDKSVIAIQYCEPTNGMVLFKDTILEIYDDDSVKTKVYFRDFLNDVEEYNKYELNINNIEYIDVGHYSKKIEMKITEGYGVNVTFYPEDKKVIYNLNGHKYTGTCEEILIKRFK